jgi:hypothetical protein
MDARDFYFKSCKPKKSRLDLAYRNLINYVIETCDEEQETRWEIYKLVMLEIINSKKDVYLDEIKYRLTDGEDPNTIMLDLINRDPECMGSLYSFLKRTIEGYIEDDICNKFY